MKKIIFFFTVFIFSGTSTLFASHLMGGEITWRCDGNGQFIFQVKEYRDCNGIPGDVSITLTTNAPGVGGAIFCTKISQTDISPIGPGCPTCANPQGFSNAVEEFIYESAPITITGVPPTAGWYFYYTSCCRNASITNLSPTGGGNFTLRAIMYPYNGMNTSPCYDSSPQFAESPTLSIGSENPENYNEAAFDNELDSLVYTWAEPLDNGYPGTPYPFATGYTYNNPLPRPIQNPLNVGAVLNPVTGGISFTSYTTGYFVTVVKVSSYRCNILTAEVFREIQIGIVPNNITASNVLNTNPDVYINGMLSDFIDTITAGDSISIIVLANDTDVLSTTAGGLAQTLTMTAKSPEFGYQYQRTDSGCLAPPCAVLTNPTMPIVSQIVAFNTMNWVTDCAHAGFFNGCLQHQRTFFFLFKVNDNMCPAQGITYRTAAITVTGPEIYLSGNDFVVSYPGVSLQWYLNGVAIPGATDTIYTPTQSGIYSVLATNGSGCTMISNSVYRPMVGLSATDASTWNLITSPNPIENHQLSFIATSPNGGNALIRLYDISGKVVYQKDLKLQAGDQHIILEIGELNSGIYQLSLVAGDQNINSKVIIQ